MNAEDRIIQYLRDHGLGITPYIDDFRHVVPGTVCIISISMWRVGSGIKNYRNWIKLNDILADPSCPIRMEDVESSPNERPGAFNRLVLKDG